MSTQPAIETTEWISASEVAKKFNVKKATIFSWIKKGKLLYQKNKAGVFLFEKSHVAELQKNAFRRGLVERREEERFPIRYPVNLIVTHHRETWEFDAITTNLSPVGLRLEVFQCPQLKSEMLQGLLFDVKIIGFKKPLFSDEIKGTLRRFEYLGDNDLAVGIALNQGQIADQ